MKFNCQKSIFYIALIALYALIFILIYGYTNFDIHYTDWCMLKHELTNSDDIAWNYLNFFAFLNDSVSIPFYQQGIYPFQGGAFYIDYAPIIMIPVKIFYKYILHYKGIIDIQYVWYFGIISFILQGLLSFKIIKKLTDTNNINAILCSIFFVIAPPLLFKFPYQFTLCAHFLILLSFLPFIYSFSKKQLILFYFFLSFFTCGIMVYFIPFIFVNLGAYVFYRYYKIEKNKLFSIIYILMLFIGSIIPVLIFGGFTKDLNSSALGWGVFSANLNTFINPVNVYGLFHSNLFPFLNNLKLYIINQNEGFAYLGGGFLLLLIISIFLTVKKCDSEWMLKFTKKYKLEIITYFAVFIILFMCAITTTVTLSDNKIIDIPLSQDILMLLSLFRSSGRFIWNSFYLIYFAVFVIFLKNITVKKASIILFLCLFAQIYDIHDALLYMHGDYQTKKEYINPVDNNINWKKIVKNKKNIVISNFYPMDFINVTNWAIKNNFNINNLQLSRDLDYPLFYFNLFKKYENPQKDDIYVFGFEDEGFIVQETKLKNCYEATSKYIACTLDEIENLEKLKLNSNMRYKKGRAYSFYRTFLIESDIY